MSICVYMHGIGIFCQSNYKRPQPCATHKLQDIHHPQWLTFKKPACQVTGPLKIPTDVQRCGKRWQWFALPDDMLVSTGTILLFNVAGVLKDAMGPPSHCQDVGSDGQAYTAASKVPWVSSLQG